MLHLHSLKSKIKSVQIPYVQSNFPFIQEELNSDLKLLIYLRLDQ